MNASSVAVLLAGLLIVVSLIQPLARRLDLSPSVLQAAIGVLIGVGAALAVRFVEGPFVDELTAIIVAPPLDSDTMLSIFLPLLLFHATLSIDLRRMAEDAGAILLMAIVAVVVSTFAIGYALAPFAPVSLAACLLLGAIVATTDPVAVVNIFRDIGAPARLGRLVEGESLLNDAAAIALYAILLAVVTGQGALDPATAIIEACTDILGGLAVGFVLARLFVFCLPIVHDFKLAQATLSLALPYTVYFIGQEGFALSGDDAVVAAGLTFKFYASSYVPQEGWSYLETIWDQIGYWASALIVILGGILVPAFLDDLRIWDPLLFLLMIAAAFGARAAVLFGLLPIMTRLRMAQAVSSPYKIVVLWGGLRGAVTLVLALGVVENPGIASNIDNFVVGFATLFVLFTQFIQGTTLKPLIAALGLQKLSPLDAALRDQVLGLAASEVRTGVMRAAAAYRIDSAVAEAVAAPYDFQAQAAAQATVDADEILDRDRITLGLIALANQERALTLDYFGRRVISSRIIAPMLTWADRLAEGARTGGRVGYRRVARQMLDFAPTLRPALWVHRYLQRDAWLSRILTRRFESLMVRRILIGHLLGFNRARLRPLLGERVADILAEILNLRHEATEEALEALRLQYPDYAAALEGRMLRKTALRLEETEYEELNDARILSPELYGELRRRIAARSRDADIGLHLDLSLETRELLGRVAFLAGLPSDELDEVAAILHPLFVVPGQYLFKEGMRGDAAYFISSGAVAVELATGEVRLGRGEVFGEMALVDSGLRSASVRAISYCRLLRLSRDDFMQLTRRNARIARLLDQIATDRRAQNQA